MPNYDSTSRTPFAKGGRAGFKNGSDYESEKESKLYKKSLQGGDAKVAEVEAKASKKMKAEVAAVAKKKRDRLQARHIPPGGGGRKKPGPHKIDYNRRDLKPLLKWLPEKTQEKALAFANKMDDKLEAHYKKKATKKKMQKRAKKLTAYERIT